MFKSYLRLTLRNFAKNKIYNLINLLGLAIGLTCAMLIGLYVQNELQYDQFHQNGAQIYRLLKTSRTTGGKASINANTSGALGNMLVAEFPEVKDRVRRMSREDVWVEYGQKGFFQRFCTTDTNVLEIFSFPLVKGNKETALQKHGSAVITEDMAQKYFGKEDPIGKLLTCEDRYYGGEYTVTGVLKNIPSQSHIQFDILAASRQTDRAKGYWEYSGFYPWSSFHPLSNYIVLEKGASPKTLESKLPDFVERHLGKEAREAFTFHLQPFNRIYLYSATDYDHIFSLVDRGLPTGDIRQIYLFSIVGIFIIILACINFTNLATARASQRAKEVGMRKVVGAERGQLLAQFLGESILLTTFALLTALLIVALILPSFNASFNKTLALSNLGIWWLSLPIIAILVGCLAGIYPSLFLSNFRPIAVLKGAFPAGSKRAWLRKGLVIFQFAISILLIVGTVVVHQQMTYIQNKKLGFNTTQTLFLPIVQNNPQLESVLTTEGRPLRDRIKHAFLQHPDVVSATLFNYFWMGEQYATVQPEGFGPEEWRMFQISGDEDFLKTFDMQLVAGRFFSKDIPSDADEAYLLNETAVKGLGWQDPLGKRFRWSGREGKIIGVVKDFHHRSLHDEIRPIFIQTNWKLGRLALKIETKNMPEVMAFLKDTWQTLSPDRPFDYQFMDERIGALYRSEARFGQLFGIFALLTIFVACLGVLGLATFMAEQRTKEIGVRKVLGASSQNIVRLLSQEFVWLVALANLIAWPIGYWGISRWLENFVYHINLSIYPFALSGCLALLLALVTVGQQAWRSAHLNPTDALKHE